MTLSLDTAYRSFGGEVEASSTPTICRLPDSRRHQLWAIAPILRANIDRETALMTDEARFYMEVGKDFASHEAVNHGVKEYVRYWNEVTDKTRPDGKPHVETTTITTNTVEGFYSIFKRGMKGVYQHCSEKHLHRYLAEFDFRYSNRVALGVNDGERRTLAIKGAAGKRLTYRGRH